MNREAVALGVPVYTTFGGRLGAVDEGLIREGRLVRLTDAAALDLGSLPPRRERERRDPNAPAASLLLDRRVIWNAAGGDARRVRRPEAACT